MLGPKDQVVSYSGLLRSSSYNKPGLFGELGEGAAVLLRAAIDAQKKGNFREAEILVAQFDLDDPESRDFSFLFEYKF